MRRAILRVFRDTPLKNMKPVVNHLAVGDHVLVEGIKHTPVAGQIVNIHGGHVQVKWGEGNNKLLWRATLNLGDISIF